ncbi:MAG: hypothetical protein ACYDCN_11380 [Bacteroidia bacterium]
MHKSKIKTNSLLAAMFAALFLVQMQSCRKEDKESESNEIKTSAYQETKSHNMGQNCMNCHTSTGAGEGIFIAAGTVYDSLKTATQPNGTIKLYTAPNARGTLIATIPVDANGNFYTTTPINFAGGLYPSITGQTGDTRYMQSAIQMGACNSCHGVSNDKIWVK